MLYNELQKNRYIEQSDMTSETKEVFIRIATTAAKVELQEGSDLVHFTRPQVVNLLKTYNARSRSYLRLICKHFSNYYEWCLSESLIDMGDITNWYDIKLARPIISEVLPNELIEEKFFDKETMVQYVENVMDKSNKLLLYAPFLGIDGNNHEDLKYLKIDDLDLINKTITLYSGKTVKVDDLFIKLINEANQSSRYDKDGSGQITAGRSEYGESQYVLKMCGTEKIDDIITNSALLQRYSLIKEQAGNDLLNIKLVYKNGLLNYIKEYFEHYGISLYDALYSLNVTGKGKYKYTEEIERLIEEYGDTCTARFLRMQMKDTIQFYD